MRYPSSPLVQYAVTNKKCMRDGTGRHNEGSRIMRASRFFYFPFL